MLFRKNDIAPVTPADAEDAKRELQRRTAFNIDEFLRTSTVDTLFNSPLGPTPRCLSVDEIVAATRATIESARRTHLDVCLHCAGHLRTYQSLETIQWNDVSRNIDIVDYIRVPAGGNLFLVLRNVGKESILGGLEPETIRITGAIDGRVGHVNRLDPAPYKATEAVEVHFGRNFTLHVPETGKVVDYVDLYAETVKGPLCKRQLVQIIDESKINREVSAGAI